MERHQCPFLLRGALGQGKRLQHQLYPGKVLLTPRKFAQKALRRSSDESRSYGHGGEGMGQTPKGGRGSLPPPGRELRLVKSPCKKLTLKPTQQMGLRAANGLNGFGGGRASTAPPRPWGLTMLPGVAMGQGMAIGR